MPRSDLQRNVFGVPCSRLGSIETDIHCTSEEEAMALAAGAWLARGEATVYMQNSGLCRCVDITLSLYKPYGIPLPRLLLSIRKKPDQHKFAGEVTHDLLKIEGWNDNLEVRYEED